MKIFCKFPTVNISKLNFWLVICIAKNFIWTTLKMIFSIFRFFCTLRFQIYKILSYHNKPYINGKIIYSAFRWCIHFNFQKLTLMTGFVLQGHKYIQWNKCEFGFDFINDGWIGWGRMFIWVINKSNWFDERL